MTSLAGTQRTVSGVVIVPNGPGPHSGRDIVSWAHPTTGIAQGCAPSTDGDLFASIPSLSSLLSHGYIIAATDYPGLCTPGMHPYLVGVSEARSVIDAVRAARHLLGAGASKRYVGWGHSQGAQAVLFVGQIAASYAPELQLAGVVAAAPPTELKQGLHDVMGTVEGRLLAAYMLVSWSSVYDTPLDSVTHCPAIPIVRLVARQCAQTDFEKGAVMLSARLLTQHMLLPEFWTTQPWVGAAQENSADPLRVGAPLLVAQGTSDDVVTPSMTQAFVQSACRAGASVDFVRIAGGGHSWAAFDSAAVATDWIANRFASSTTSRHQCTKREIPALKHPTL
jgi:predicted esterase